MMLQRLAIQKFHGDERAPILLADVVNRANVGMIQGRSRPCFAPETFQRLLIARKCFRQEFQRDESPKPAVFRLVDDAHAPAA